MRGRVVCFSKMSHTSGDWIEHPPRILNVRPAFHSVEDMRAQITAVRGMPDGRSAGFLWTLFLSPISALPRKCGMKFVILSWLAVVLSGCVTSTTRIDPRDFAVSTCDLTQEQLALAQTRAREYLNRYPSAAADVRLVAVIADSVFPSEVADLWVKLGRSQTSSSAYLQRRGQTFRLWCVAVLDRSTLIPVTNSGYLLANTPARGEVVHLSDRIVLYIGRGI